jgi:hypothetical protein|tara:strand:- start:1194 stop:1760 length:567 start_codon:yes stop_codon:yes gene_type:complete
VALFRKGKGAAKSDDAILAIAVAEQTLSSTHQMFTTGKVGLTFKPDNSEFFSNLEHEMRQLLAAGEKMTGTKYNIVTDDYGYRWIIMADDQFEDLAMAVYAVGQSFNEHGCRDQLLAAVFPFTYEGKSVEWIYTYKRGTFYPFVPGPDGQHRDNKTEIDLSGRISKLLPMEKKLDQWYALWGVPFDAV